MKSPIPVSMMISFSAPPAPMISTTPAMAFTASSNVSITQLKGRSWRVPNRKNAAIMAIVIATGEEPMKFTTS